MSVLEEVLEEEYGRSVRLIRHMQSEIDSLPKGSIRVRSIRGREYYYLNYRVVDKVKSDYIRASEVNEIREKIERRKKLKEIERALGRAPHVE